MKLRIGSSHKKGQKTYTKTTLITDVRFFVGGGSYPNNLPTSGNEVYEDYTIQVPPDAKYFYYSYKINAPLFEISKE